MTEAATDSAAAEPAVAIAVERVTKRYGRVEAAAGVTLHIAEGEFFSLLGPSGCGKTTTLRMIAGFVLPDEGRILLRGRDVTGRPPNRRDLNMAFQSYALFPHMNVHDNVAYPLKLRKVPRREREERVEAMLASTGLEGLGKRRPRQLSGGQQQRVALARALINRPAALLLDEPLGALDVKLRRQMQLELKRIQLELGTTFVYVTHDQEEALAMSDRIAVMNDGRVEQVGESREIYERPRTDFTAAFVGSLNALELRVDELSAEATVMRLPSGQRLVGPPAADIGVGVRLRLAVRPECVQLHAPPGEDVPPTWTKIEAVVRNIVYLGSIIQYFVESPSLGSLTSHRLNDRDGVELGEGQRVVVTWPPERVTLI